jgi:carbamoyl-phosphate synthase large subunit
VKIEGPNDPGLPSAFDQAISYSMIKKVIVEDFVDGKEVTVEGLCSNGKHRCFAISLKDHFRVALANRLHYPANIPEDLQDKIFTALDLFVDASGLKFGITHAELFVDVPKRKFWLVEIACRGGGTLISSDIAPWVSGVNFYEILFGDLQKKSTDLQKFKRLTRGALLGFFEFKPGKVKSIQGVDEVKTWKEVRRIQLEFSVGDTIRSATDDRSRQGFAIVFGETGDEAEKLWYKVRQKIKVETA